MGRFGSDYTCSGQDPLLNSSEHIDKPCWGPKNREFFLFEICGSHSSDGAGSCFSI